MTISIESTTIYNEVLEALDTFKPIYVWHKENSMASYGTVKDFYWETSSGGGGIQLWINTHSGSLDGSEDEGVWIEPTSSTGLYTPTNLIAVEPLD